MPANFCCMSDMAYKNHIDNLVVLFFFKKKKKKHLLFLLAGFYAGASSKL